MFVYGITYMYLIFLLLKDISKGQI